MFLPNAILNPTSFGRATAVVRDRCDVPDCSYQYASSLEGPDRRLAAWSRPSHEYLYLPDAMLHAFTGRVLAGTLGCKRSGLARSLKPNGTRAPPSNRVSLRIGDSNHGVVEGRLNVCPTNRDGLALSAPCARFSGHSSSPSSYFLVTDARPRPATATLRPRLVREFVLVR